MPSTSGDIRDILPERFTIIGEIGRGGMATVYQAEERHPRRMVAVKVYNPELGARLGRERFIREVELLSNLNHPHIVPIFAAGEAHGLLYYVMPFQEGENLRERIHREGQLPIRFALQIAQEIADALEYAHSKNVLHRDIKPENVLISDNHAVVADFGIARAISASVGPQQGLTEEGLSVGTPHYMSPEQASIGDTLDGRSDIYSLGCVLYEMLAGEPPFMARTSQAVMARHAVDPVPNLRTVRPTVPEAVERAVQKALAKSPADRFTTAAEFSETLDTAKAMAQLEASTPSQALAALTPRSAARVPRRLALPAAIVVLALIAAAIWPRGPGGPAQPVMADYLYEDSVAVLPFTNIGGDDEFAHLGTGLSYEITSQLAQFGRLKVSARTSVMALAEAGLTTPQIADSLGVRYLVEGSVQPSTNGVRVTADLVEARTGAILWSNQYQRELTDVLMVQTDIAREVSNALLSTVAGDLERKGLPRGAHTAAHAPYLEGRDLLAKRTPEAFRGAIDAFQRAIRIDSGYAPPFGGLASAYALSVTYRYRVGMDAYRAAGTALALADRAIELDPELASAYSARGYAASLALAPVDQVRADFSRAMDLQPNSPDGPAWAGHLLVREGRFEDALRTARRAVRLDPVAASRRLSLAYEALRDRRYGLVLEQTEVAQRLSPTLWLPRELRGIALLLDGRAEECAAMDLGPYDALRATCLYEAGRVDEAGQIVDSLAAILRSGGEVDTLFTNVIAAQGLAGYYAWLGDVEQSLEWVTLAYDLSPSGVDLRVIESGMFDGVREAPRFASGLADLREQIWPRVSEERRRARVGG